MADLVSPILLDVLILLWHGVGVCIERVSVMKSDRFPNDMQDYAWVVGHEIKRVLE